ATPSCPPPQGKGWSEDLMRLMASPNIASRRWIFEQYDTMVQTNTVVPPGDGDAAVIRLEGTSRLIGMTMDSCPRYASLDPYEGARLAVAEACRNLACVGAEPAGVTDCLNFANPEKPDRFWQFTRSIEG